MSYKLNLPVHSVGDRCPACSADKDKGGRFVIKNSKFTNNGNKRLFFLSCSRYPLCKYYVSGKQVVIHSNPRFSPPKRKTYQMVGKSGKLITRFKPEQNRGK